MFGIIASIAGPVLSGFMGANAASDAASTQGDATVRAAQIQSDATQKSIAEMARQYDLTRSDQAPFVAGGNDALARLKSMMGIGNLYLQGGGALPSWIDKNRYSTDKQYRGAVDYEDQALQGAYGKGADNAVYAPDSSHITDEVNALMKQVPASTRDDPGALNQRFSISDFWKDPVVQASYQSGLDLGTKALKNAAPLTTGIDSGAALKELTKFGTDYTGNMAAGSQNRFVGTQTNDYNRLMGIITGGQTANAVDANAGATAASGIAGATMAGGTNIANLYSSLGNSQAAAKIAGANSWGNGLSSVSNFWNQQQMLDKISNGGTWTMNQNGYNINPNSYSRDNGYGP